MAASDTTRPEAMVDWYAVLGVAPDAGAEEIREAWRSLARVWHPDANPGAADAAYRFHLIQSAHRVLGDADARRQHDAARQMYADVVAPLPRGLIERLIGVRRPDVVRGRNRRYRLAVGAADVVTGRQMTIAVPGETGCHDCAGSGLGREGRPNVCPSCGGRCFEVQRPVLRAVGEPCARCDAAGWVPEPACVRCAGRGRVPADRWVDVRVPAGACDGQVYVVSGLGEPGRGGAEAGDLEVVISVASDERWRVVGDDWFGVCEIPFWRAVAGGRIEVATPWGARVVKLPAGTREGERLCLSGLGVDRRGDGFLEVRCTWPGDLDETETAELVAWGRAVEARRGGEKGGSDVD